MRVKEVSDVRYVMCDITHMNCIRRNACWWSQANEIWNTGNGFYKTKTELFHKFLLMLQFILFVHLIQTDDLVSKTEVDDKVDTTIVRFRFYFAHDFCFFFFLTIQPLFTALPFGRSRTQPDHLRWLISRSFPPKKRSVRADQLKQ